VRVSIKPTSGSADARFHVDGVNSRNRRDPIDPDGTRRVVLAATGFRRVPTVPTSSIPATSTPVRPLTCGNAPRGGGSSSRLLFPCRTRGFAAGTVTRRDRAGRDLERCRRSLADGVVLTASTRLHSVTWRAIAGRSLCQMCVR